MQRAMYQVSPSCDNYDLTISTKTTEAFITVNGQKLKVVAKFTYLGSTLSRAVHIDDEATARIAKASVVFGRLRANVWERNGIKLESTRPWYCQPICMHMRPGQYVYQRHAKRLSF